MCNEVKIPEMAGLHDGHRNLLQSTIPEMKGVIGELHDALTKNLNPHLPALPALIAMVEATIRQDYGVLGAYRLVRLPLSIVGSDKVRYRTPVVSWLHEIILSVRMSDITVEQVRKVLKKHGLCMFFMCSCGVVMGRCEDVHRYYGSGDHRDMDRLRSGIDSSGNPVKEIPNLESIPVLTMDLHENGAEERLFHRIEELTRFATTAGSMNLTGLDEALMDRIRVAHPEKTLVAA